MPGGIFFIIVAILVFAVIAAVHGHQKEKERVSALAAFAAKSRFMFHREKVRGFDREYPEFGFLKNGSNRYARYIMTGRWENFDVMVFDYHYETTSTDSKGNTTTHHHYFSVVMLQPEFPVFPLKIRKENFFDRMGSAFGFNDIDFESAEFSRRFHVSSPDKRWAYDVIHPRAMDLLLANSEYGLELDHERLCVWKKGRVNPMEVPAALDLGKRFLDGVPEFRKSSHV